jgi:hypothetical protein
LGYSSSLQPYCTALPSSRELNPSPFTISVVRTNFYSMTFSC